MITKKRTKVNKKGNSYKQFGLKQNILKINLLLKHLVATQTKYSQLLKKSNKCVLKTFKIKEKLIDNITC